MDNLEGIGQVRYHNNFTQELVANQADELMIANFINVLTVGSIYCLMTEEERELIRTVVKNHTVLKSRMTLEAQKQMLTTQEQTMKL